MATPEDESRGFKVQDRRRFTPEGETRAESAPAPDPAPARAEEPPVAEEKHSPGGSPTPPIEINFSTFIISLGTQALAYLGEIPNPVDRSSVVDLVAAKEMIDILSMLREKTRGNLEKGEEGLLENLLYDLRLKYVERVRSQSSRSGS